MRDRILTLNQPICDACGKPTESFNVVSTGTLVVVICADHHYKEPPFPLVPDRGKSVFGIYRLDTDFNIEDFKLLVTGGNLNAALDFYEEQTGYPISEQGIKAVESAVKRRNKVCAWRIVDGPVSSCSISS